MMAKTSAPPFTGYVRAKRIASFCSVSLSLVRQHWCKEPDFPRPLRLGRHTVLWSAEEVLAWLKKHHSRDRAEKTGPSAARRACAMRELIAARRDAAPVFRWSQPVDFKEES